MVRMCRLRLAGHMLRWSENRSANIAMNCILEDGERARGKTKELVYNIHGRSARYGVKC